MSWWKDILREDKTSKHTKFYEKGFLEQVKREGLQDELAELEERYDTMQETYGHLHYHISEPIFDSYHEGHSAKQSIAKVHRWLDSETEDSRLNYDVEEEMKTMPELRMVPQPSKEWDRIKEKLIAERKKGV